MVTTARAVGLAAILLIAMAPGPGLASAEPAEDPAKAVGSALEKGSYPWYDTANDRTKPLYQYGVPSGNTSAFGVLDKLVGLLFFGLAALALLALLYKLWTVFSPTQDDEASRIARARGEPSRTDALPEGMRREFESSDPWEEAIRRRDRGDLSGAVICLFAHQLLTLSKLGLVRLAPGRTGRQLLRSVSDAEFRGLVQPTLRLFEAAYYGHRAPSPEQFASLWERAEAFENRVAGGVVG